MRPSILVPLLLLLGGSTSLPPHMQPATSTVVLDIPTRADGTPSLAADGPFVAVVWGASANGKADVFVATSEDGGRTFAAPVQVNTTQGEARLGGELPPRVAVHRVAGRREPTVTVLWNARGATTEIKASRSRDGGRTFDAPVSLQAAGAAGDRGWPALAVDGSGGAHAVWLDHRGLAARRAADGGSAPPRSHSHAAKAPTGDGSTMAQHSALYYAALGGSAVTAAERAITPGVCYCCKTALAAGPDGLIAAAWRHVYPGDFRDMAMALSRDGGRTFSAPARVSEDGWSINGCPDDGPAVVVDRAGTVHIVWPTVIPGESPEGALFYASTTDGRTFTPRVRIPTLGSPKPMHPQLALAGDGRLVVAWDEVLDGARVAAARLLRVRPGDAAAFGDAVRLADGGAASHPVVATTDTGVVAVWSTGGEASRVVVRQVAGLTDARGVPAP